MRSASLRLERRLRQVRQPLGQFERQLFAEQAERAGQPLALSDEPMSGAGETGDGFGMERLFAHPVELVQIAGLLHPLSKLAGHVGRLDDLLAVADHSRAATAPKNASAPPQRRRRRRAPPDTEPPRGAAVATAEARGSVNKPSRSNITERSISVTPPPRR